MKVHVVSKGEYSDWEIWGIYSSREKAEAVIAKAKGVAHRWKRLNDTIVEYMVDKPAAQRCGFEVGIHIETGEVVFGPQFIKFPAKKKAVEESPEYVIARGLSPERALKIAQDRRAKILAERAGL